LKRPTLDQILEHEFFSNGTGGSIPRVLPASFLACPPSHQYIKQFKPIQTPQLGKYESADVLSTMENKPGLKTQRPTAPGTQKAEVNPRMFSERAGLQERLKIHPASAKENNIQAVAVAKEEVWVKKWVDYSTKYGLGYLLSNQMMGVFFNDSTKILLLPDSATFNYYERR